MLYEVITLSMRLSKKWRFLLDAPFLISNRCCWYMKEQPMYSYSKRTGRKSFVGIIAYESENRKRKYLKHGCNAFTLDYPMSTPLAFWTEEDIWEYIKRFDVPRNNFV